MYIAGGAGKRIVFLFNDLRRVVYSRVTVALTSLLTFFPWLLPLLDFENDLGGEFSLSVVAALNV